MVEAELGAGQNGPPELGRGLRRAIPARLEEPDAGRQLRGVRVAGIGGAERLPYARRRVEDRRQPLRCGSRRYPCELLDERVVGQEHRLLEGGDVLLREHVREDRYQRLLQLRVLRVRLARRCYQQRAVELLGGERL